jgi:hypothetical protein
MDHRGLCRAKRAKEKRGRKFSPFRRMPRDQSHGRLRRADADGHRTAEAGARRSGPGFRRCIVTFLIPGSGRGRWRGCLCRNRRRDFRRWQLRRYGGPRSPGEDAFDARASSSREEKYVDHKAENDECGGEHLCGADQKVRGPSYTEDHADISAAESPGEPSSLAGLHQYDDHQQEADNNLKRHQDGEHEGARSVFVLDQYMQKFPSLQGEPKYCTPRPSASLRRASRSPLCPSLRP